MDPVDPMRPPNTHRRLSLEMRVENLAQLIRRQHHHRVSLVLRGHAIQAKTGDWGRVWLVPGHAVGFDSESLHIVKDTRAVEFVGGWGGIVCCAWLFVESRSGLDEVDLDVLFCKEQS